ncbi:hypothetical protein [Vibrio tubiashii]|uniref:hypothetical protein n=1 Tax=Vibrio tubiashii TaxID=29498 RepID=UPI00349E59C4
MRRHISRLLGVMFAMVVGGAWSTESDVSTSFPLYTEVAQTLLASGWQRVPAMQGETSLSPDYPEVTCGEGVHAICTVGFKLDEEYRALVVEWQQGTLRVVGEY